MRTSLPSVGALVLSLFASTSASATFCTGWPTPCQAYEEASAVFIGAVVAVERVAPSRARALAPPFAVSDRMASTTVFPVQWVARLRVEQAIKGMREREVELSSDSGDAYTPGQRYLIYANRDQVTGALSPIACGRSSLVEHAADDLLYLRQIGKVARSSRLAGAVRRYDTIPGEVFAFVETLARARVTLTDRKGAQYEKRTNEDGVYEWFGLAPGAYVIHVDLPAHLSPVEWTPNDRVVEVSAGTCTTADVTVRSTGSVSGRVADAVGRGVVDTVVGIIRAERTDQIGRYVPGQVYALTDYAGNYSIGELPPGRYLVGINLDRAPAADSPYPRTFHPRGDLADAVAVTLGEGEQAMSVDIRLPPRLAVRQIIGRVIDAGQRPLAGARVWLDDDDDPTSIPDYATIATADVLGRFVMDVLESADGWLQASTRADPDLPMGSSIPDDATIAKADSLGRFVMDVFEAAKEWLQGSTGGAPDVPLRYAAPLAVDFRASTRSFNLVVPAR